MKCLYFNADGFLYLMTWWQVFGYRFLLKRRLIPRPKNPASWYGLLRRTDIDAKIIKKLIRKISVFPRYEGMTSGEIYKEITNVP